MISLSEHRASVTQTKKKVRITYSDYDNRTTKTIGDRFHCAGMTGRCYINRETPLIGT